MIVALEDAITGDGDEIIPLFGSFFVGFEKTNNFSSEGRCLINLNLLVDFDAPYG